MCCGQQRAAARMAARAAEGVTHAPAPAHSPATSVIVFEHTGASSATFRGEASGRLYRFAPGQRLRVDPRDRPTLAKQPQLTWIR